MVHQGSDTPTPAPKPNQNTPPPTGAPQAEQIKIGFNDSNGSGLEFKLKTSTKLGKAMNAFSAHMQRDIKQLRFLFEGHRLQPDDTPQSLEMEDGDKVEVHMEQIGGGPTEKTAYPKDHSNNC